MQVTPPSKLLVTAGQESKSDRLDCQRLAVFSAKKLLSFVTVPTPEQEADRQLLRLREQMVRKSRCIQQQIKSFLLQFSIPEPEGLSNWTNAAVEELRHTTLLPELRFCLDMLLEEYQHAKQQLARLKQEIRKLAQAERHQETVRLLQSVPGVGAITSIVFRTELVDPGRFRDGRQVSKMLGLAPGVRASGETRREGNILRSGNKRLRSVLVESAWRWIAGDGHAAAIYHRLVRNTGSAKKAIVGMARRLGILLWRISVSRQVYQPG